jgi:hypothetical protein
LWHDVSHPAAGSATDGPELRTAEHGSGRWGVTNSARRQRPSDIHQACWHARAGYVHDLVDGDGSDHRRGHEVSPLRSFMRRSAPLKRQGDRSHLAEVRHQRADPFAISHRACHDWRRDWIGPRNPRVTRRPPRQREGPARSRSPSECRKSSSTRSRPTYSFAGMSASGDPLRQTTPGDSVGPHSPGSRLRHARGACPQLDPARFREALVDAQSAPSPSALMDA